MTTSTLEPDTIVRPDVDADEAFRSIVENEEKIDHSDGDQGDHDRMAHYVAKDDIVKSSMTGAAVYALCGKKWTPNRSPQNYPVCPKCVEIHEGIAE